jgi:Family of unknown function (DUF6000)
MRYPGADDPELLAAVRRYVDSGSARYSKLLHGNALDMSGTDRTEFESAMGRDARKVSDRELGTLLDSEWRSRLTAAWLIGLDRRTHFRDRIGEMLLDSELVYAGQGYCLALARFETAVDADILSAYLDRYLPLDRPCDQNWAIGALLHLDERLGANRADRFLIPGGLWEKSVTSRNDPAEQRRFIARLCAFADECMRGLIGRPEAAPCQNEGCGSSSSAAPGSSAARSRRPRSAAATRSRCSTGARPTRACTRASRRSSGTAPRTSRGWRAVSGTRSSTWPDTTRR